MGQIRKIAVFQMLVLAMAGIQCMFTDEGASAGGAIPAREPEQETGHSEAEAGTQQEQSDDAGSEDSQDAENASESDSEQSSESPSGTEAYEG